jgi:hypothetical protein
MPGRIFPKIAQRVRTTIASRRAVTKTIIIIIPAREETYMSTAGRDATNTTDIAKAMKR